MVTLTASGAGSATAIIYYTTDLSPVVVPNGAGGAGGAGGMDGTGTLVYDGAIPIADTTVLKFLAVAADGTETNEDSEGYVKATIPIEEQWANSGHGDITAEAWRHWDPEGHVSGDSGGGCAKCHSAPGMLQYSDTGANPDTAPLPLGLDCAGCHGVPFNPLTIFAELGTYQELEPVAFPSGDTGTFMNPSNICMTCHQGRESGSSLENPTPNEVEQTPTDYPSYDIIQIHYFAAAATLFGSDVGGGYEYGAGGTGGAPTYRGQNKFPAHVAITAPLTDCLQCHMNADAADDKNHTFLPKVVNCTTGTGCHTDTDGTFEGLDGSPSTNFNAIQTLESELLTAIQAYANTGLPQASPVIYDDHAYPYWFKDNGMGPIFPNAYKDFDLAMLRAAYNYQTARKDPGGFIHNGTYIEQLLFDSTVAMGGTPSVPRP